MPHKINPDEPIFELADVRDATCVDTARIQAWLQRGIIWTAHKPTGRGDLRLFSVREALWIQMLAYLSDIQGLEPRAYSSLARIATGAIVQGVEGDWALGRPNNDTVTVVAGNVSLDEAAAVWAKQNNPDAITSPSIVAVRLTDYREVNLPAAEALARLILMRRQITANRKLDSQRS